MQRRHWALIAIGTGLSFSAAAQSPEFSLTYHIERTPAAQLSIETCGETVSQVAQREGLQTAMQHFPGQLVTVRGGAENKGVFVVQCIAVDNTTVSVVQGIDYRAQKGPLGSFADQAFSAVKAAAR